MIQNPVPERKEKNEENTNWHMAMMAKNGSHFAINTPDCAVVCCDSDDLIISWDVQAERLFGWEHGLVLGNKLFKRILSPASDLQSGITISSLFHQYRKERSVTIKIDDIGIHRNGQTFPIELVISTLPGGDFFIVYIRNLRTKEENEKGEAGALFKREVTNTIFRISFKPALLKERLKAILEYLVSLKELNLLPAAALYLFEQDTEKLVLTASCGIDHSEKKNENDCCRVAFGTGGCGKAALTNKIQFISAAAGQNHCEHLLSIRHGHYYVPVSIHGLVTGVISCYLPEGHKRSERTEDILISAAQAIALIIDHQKMDLQLVNLVNDLRASIVALREEKNFSESVIEGLEHGLVVTDTNGLIQKSNEAAKKIFAPFSTDIEGYNLASVIGDKNARLILSREKDDATAEENEIRLTTAAGEDLILRYSTVMRSNAKGGDVGTIISLTDISEWLFVRKEMEKMNRLATVAEIASAVAHEVRNPLAGIKIMAQSIEEDFVTKEEKRECSQRIIRQVDRLNELLTDFFSYARPVIPKKQKISLTHILSETKPLILNKLVEQRIYLLEDLHPELPPVIADPNQMQQVFLNLFLNAIDAIKQEGTIEIIGQKISGQKLAMLKKKNHLLDANKDYVMVFFKDNGSGMSHEAAEQVFEPFYTTKSNGSGLGMSIVYRTMKENDAVITVDSAEGKGTTFTMFFKSG